MADPKNPSTLDDYLAAAFAGVNRGGAHSVEKFAEYADKATKLVGHPTHLAGGLEEKVYASLQSRDEKLDHLKPYDPATATRGERRVEQVGTLVAPTAAFAVSALGLVAAAPEAAVVAGGAETAEIAETAGAGMRALSTTRKAVQVANAARNGGTLAAETVRVAKGLDHVP